MTSILLDCAPCDDHRAERSSASSGACWRGTPSTAATCPGVAPASRIACWCRRSCSSKRRSTGWCRSIASSFAATRPSSRPVRLHAIARETVARYGGRLPDREEALRELPGVGRYTAGAILSFAYGRDTAVLDTNVRRVLGRVFMGPRRLAHVRGQREFWALAAALVPRGRGYDFNQALMDFGATWCTPRKPRCGPCPMKRFCASYERA